MPDIKDENTPSPFTEISTLQQQIAARNEHIKKANHAFRIVFERERKLARLLNKLNRENQEDQMRVLELQGKVRRTAQVDTEQLSLEEIQALLETMTKAKGE